MDTKAYSTYMPGPNETLLRGMLKLLHLPEPFLSLNITREDLSYAQLRFTRAKSAVEVTDPIRMRSKDHSSDREAKEDVCGQALKHMEEYLQEKMTYHQQEATKLRSHLDASRKKMKDISRGWDATITHSEVIAKDLRTIVRNHSPNDEAEVTAASVYLKVVLNKFSGIADDIDHYAIQATEKLQTIGVYPYGDDIEELEDPDIVAEIKPIDYDPKEDDMYLRDRATFFYEEGISDENDD